MDTLHRSRIYLLVFAAAFAGACGERTLKEPAPSVAVEHERPDAPDALKPLLAVPPAWSRGDRELWNAVRVAYRLNDGALLWLDDAEPREQATQLRAAIANAAMDGLDPMQYDTHALDTLQRVDAGLFSAERYLPDAAAEVDARLTFAAASLARDLRGRVEPAQVGENWFGARQPVSIGKLVHAAAGSTDVEATLRKVAPQHRQYARLREVLGELRAIAARGGWPEVPAGAAIASKSKDPDLSPFRARLAASGHYVATSTGNAGAQAAPDTATTTSTRPAAGAEPVAAEAAASPNAAAAAHDAAVSSAERAALREAVARFQREHGLEDDGIPGKETIAAMNVPVGDRIRQLEVNLERMRWLPHDLGETHVLVNVPTFHLEAVRAGRPELAMRVVTGRSGTPTPIFSDTMETVVFSPYWNVPASILRNEVVPALRKNSGYLARENMEVLRNGVRVSAWELVNGGPGLQVRQRPGAANALGHVKFLFPNPHNVYLHDTPADSLFARAARNLSHGCIRVERPFELAQWVLAGQPEWTPEKIESAMHSGNERHVALAQQIPVHIVYFTVWVEDDGTTRFANDLYRHDERHAALIPAAWPPMPRAVAAN